MSKKIGNKKSITMILTLLLLLSSIPGYGAGPTFSDVAKDHWAYEYIEDMARIGYLNGFPGGTFGPSGNLTLMQAISTLSRLVEPTSTEKNNAKEGYAYLFNELDITVDWEKDGLAIALLKGIITEDEVREAKNTNTLNKAINRERTAELLAKAMGLGPKANDLDIVYVEYEDISEVDPARRKYLRVLLDAKVLDPKGKGNNDFQPKANLTRAEMSKLLSEGVDYLEINSKGPEVVEYEYITDTIKRITKDAGTILVIENKPYDEKGYIIEDITSITVDGKKADEKSLFPGQEVKLKVKKDDIIIASIEAFSSEQEVSGVAKYVSASKNQLTLEYKEDKRLVTKDYSVDPKAKIYVNDKLADLKDIKDGDLVELRVRGNTIVEIEGISKVKKITGIISDIVPVKDGKETFHLITLEDKDEVTHKFLTDSKTDIYRKDKRVPGQDLKIKDQAYIEGEYDLGQDVFIAKLVDADVFKRRVKGQVTETINRVNKNPLITIENRETREEESYDLAREVDIIIDGKKASSLPLNPGYYAELELENDEIVEIYIDTKRAQESITGRIVDIDYREGIIYLEDNTININSPGEDEVIIYTTNNTFFSKQAGGSLKLEDLRIRDFITVIGVYKGRNFEAGTIIML